MNVVVWGGWLNWSTSDPLSWDAVNSAEAVKERTMPAKAVAHEERHRPRPTPHTAEELNGWQDAPPIACEGEV